MRSAIFALCFISVSSFQQEIDSLKSLINTEKNVIRKTALHLELAYSYRDVDLANDALSAAETALKLAQKSKSDSLKGESLITIGWIYYTSDNAPAATDNFLKGLKFSSALNPITIIRAWNSLGVIYSVYGEHSKAVDAYREAIDAVLLLREEERIKYEYLYNNLAITFCDMREFDSSWHYHKKCLETRMALHDGRGMGQTYNNVGTLYYTMEQFDSAQKYFQLGFFIRDSTSEIPVSAVVESQINIGMVYLAQKKYSQAQKILTESLQWAVDNSNPGLELRCLEHLMKCYAAIGNYEQAFESCRSFYELRDNLYGFEQREEMIRLVHENMYRQKLEHDSLITAEQKAAEEIQKAKDLEIRQHKDSTSFMVQLGLGIGFLLTLCLLLVAVRSYRNKRKSELEIRIQKDEVERQRDIAESQKILLEQVNLEIMDSIHYARRIQQAILPATATMDRILQKYFVYYRPKAIVAGDFYWVHSVDDLTYFAAADCTGHGVPGALVSVICSTALDRCIDEYGLRDPGPILDKACDLIIDTFERSGEKVRDGMDISLCCVNRETRDLLYAGANNPIVIQRAATKETERFDATRQAVGLVERRTKFESLTIKLNRGDTIYSFTDGFADQFGGKDGKKFKLSRMLELIRSLSETVMSGQQAAFEKTLEDWMQGYEQLDDICVVGFRV